LYVVYVLAYSNDYFYIDDCKGFGQINPGTYLYVVYVLHIHISSVMLHTCSCKDPGVGFNQQVYKIKLFFFCFAMFGFALYERLPVPIQPHLGGDASHMKEILKTPSITPTPVTNGCFDCPALRSQLDSWHVWAVRM
jgi:hypothetical protein